MGECGRESGTEEEQDRARLYHEFTYYYLQLEQACGLRSSSNWHTHTHHTQATRR